VKPFQVLPTLLLSTAKLLLFAVGAAAYRGGLGALA
jgi:hypothetical protein